MFVGFMVFFFFGGGISIVLISIIVSFQSIWLGIKVLAIVIVVDQVVENGLVLKLLGCVIGVYFVWILFFLMIGVKVVGLLGILVVIFIVSFIWDMFNDFIQCCREEQGELRLRINF